MTPGGKSPPGRYLVVFVTEADSVRELRENLASIGLRRSGVAVGDTVNKKRVVAWFGPDEPRRRFGFKTAARNLRLAAARLERSPVRTARLPHPWMKEWFK